MKSFYDNQKISKKIITIYLSRNLKMSIKMKFQENTVLLTFESKKYAQIWSKICLTFTFIYPQ